MMIFRENALVAEGNNLSYKGVRFNGVVLTIVNGVVEKRKVCKDGVVFGDYISPYINLDNMSLIVESAELDDEYEEPCTRNSLLYSGLTYRFDGEVCISEREYKDGWLVTEVNYRRDGSLESVDVGDDELSQKCSWFEEGHVEEFESFKRGSYRFWLKFTEEKVVTTLVIEGDYFTKVGQFRDQLAFDMFGNVDSFLDFVGADYLFISGNGVNDEVFHSLLARDGLKNTNKLNISKSAISSVVFNDLVPLENIKLLIIESDIVNVEDLRSFKELRPDCYVEFNREEVIVW